MTDITSRDLEAAILDQKVAGAMQGKRYAYTVVRNDEAGAWALGIAVENEPGYNPIDGKTFEYEGDARAWADGLNEHIGHVPRDVIDIIVTTMRERPPRRGLDTWT